MFVKYEFHIIDIFDIFTSHFASGPLPQLLQKICEKKFSNNLKMFKILTIDVLMKKQEGQSDS